MKKQPKAVEKKVPTPVKANKTKQKANATPAVKSTKPTKTVGKKPTPTCPNKATKTDIVNDLRKVLVATTLADKITVRELDFLFTLTMGAIRSRVVKGDKVRVSGFGVFALNHRAGRTLTQISGKEIRIPDHYVIRFRPAEIMRQLANNKIMHKPIEIPDALCVLAVPRGKKNKAKRRK
jgi:nucleoid DNA-binding protein